MYGKLIGAAAIALALTGCGTNPGERTTGGAAAGAATGAGIGALGGPVGVGVGALIGAGAGAATGATTTPNQVNLGRPPWRNPNANVAGEPLDQNASETGRSGNGGGSPRVRALQERLQNAGYDPGPIDGIMGAQTRRAEREYRSAQNGNGNGRNNRNNNANSSGNNGPNGAAGGNGSNAGSNPGPQNGTNGGNQPAQQ